MNKQIMILNHQKLLINLFFILFDKFHNENRFVTNLIT